MRGERAHRVTNGVLIESYQDWKNLISDIYSESWKTAKDSELKAYWGEPDSYPVIVTSYVNDMDAFQNIELHLVYLSNEISQYKISESIY